MKTFTSSIFPLVCSFNSLVKDKETGSRGKSSSLAILEEEITFSCDAFILVSTSKKSALYVVANSNLVNVTSHTRVLFTS